MADRNSTYVAFHANPAKEPEVTDVHILDLLKSWGVGANGGLTLTDSREKGEARRAVRLREFTERHLRMRLDSAKHMVLIVGETTREDHEWIPLEIRYAVDDCEIPIIATYLGHEVILDPTELAPLWPAALAKRIREGTARVIHIPFRMEALRDAIGQFGPEKRPQSGLSFYDLATYQGWGY
jgi:hypothetical protein